MKNQRAARSYPPYYMRKAVESVFRGGDSFLLWTRSDSVRRKAARWVAGELKLVRARSPLEYRHADLEGKQRKVRRRSGDAERNRKLMQIIFALNVELDAQALPVGFLDLLAYQLGVQPPLNLKKPLPRDPVIFFLAAQACSTRPRPSIRSLADQLSVNRRTLRQWRSWPEFRRLAALICKLEAYQTVLESYANR